MNITTPTLSQLKKSLGLTDIVDAEIESLLETSAETVFETAMLRFLSTLSEWEQESFETWIELHGGDSGVFTELVTLYPNFSKHLTEEILQLQK